LEKDIKDGKLTQGGAPFGVFLAREAEAKGFAAHHSEIKLVSYVAKALGRRPPVTRPSAGLSAPAIRGHNIAVGLSEEKSTEYYLVCVNSETMQTNPIQGLCRTLEAPRYPTWLPNSRVACCSVSGALNVFTFVSEKKQLSHTARIVGVHSKEVRELALCPTKQNLLASTGADGFLCVTDMESRNIVARTSLGSIGGSVKWTGYSDALGVTLDSGTLLLFDTRSNLSKPARSFATSVKTPLYTHCRYGEHFALLGFSNGHIHNIDFRTGSRVSSVEDPYVEGIGQIELAPRGDAFVTSGFYDFSVWRGNPTAGQTSIWSHSKSSASQFYDGPAGDLTYCASFLNEDELVATNSLGYMGIWQQGFDLQDQDF
jgi:WD40 repeat protein